MPKDSTKARGQAPLAAAQKRVAAACALAAAAAAVALGAPAAALAATANPGGAGAPGASTAPGATAPSAPRRTTSNRATRRPTRRASTRGSLRLLRAICLGPTGCGSDARTVTVGGRLRLSGQGLRPGMTVVFARRGASAARLGTVGAPLRPTSHGLVVTVPATAASGRILVTAAHGLRSNSFGPIRILAAPVRKGAGKQVGASPTGTAFDGLGMWIWYISKSSGGDLNAIASQAHQAGVRTLFIKSSDGSTNYWSQFSAATVAALKAQGLHVCAWQYVYGTHPAAEAQLGAQAVSDGAECLVIDAEAEYEGHYGAAQTYIKALRAAVGANFPLGLASFPYVDYHPQEPYSVFLGPGGAQFNAPQMYWKDIGTTVDHVYSHTYTFNRIYGRAIAPLGQTYGGTPPADIYSFRQYAPAYGAAGVSFWDWQETTSGGWQALSQPLTPASGVSVATDYPLLSLNAKGDPVLWMQEHLATAEPSTPTSGIFDATTQSALTSFQTAHGLPPSGQTDSATWQALLALAPTPVDWTAAGPGG